MEIDFYEACHAVTPSAPCHWIVHIQHTEEFLGGEQSILVSSPSQMT